MVFFELCLESLEQGEGIGRCAGKTGQYPILVEAPHLPGIALHHDVAHGYLTVTPNYDLSTPAYRENCRASDWLHTVDLCSPETLYSNLNPSRVTVCPLGAAGIV